MGSRHGSRSRMGGGFYPHIRQWIRPRVIRSIQRGTISIAGTTQTATITAVDLSNTRLVVTGWNDTGGGGNPSTVCLRGELTNSTTVTAYRDAGSGGLLSYEVIEYWPGFIKSVQRGTFATSAATTGSATITSVNTSRACVDYLYFTSTSGVASGPGEATGRVTLTDATTVSFEGLGSLTRTVGYQVVEYNF